MAVVENPDSVLFCAPRTRMLQAGIFDRFVRPPATPTSEVIRSRDRLYFVSPMLSLVCVK